MDEYDIEQEDIDKNSQSAKKGNETDNGLLFKSYG